MEALEEVTLYCDINGEIVLPDTVPAVMNDNSRQDVAVTWDQIDEAALKAAGVASCAGAWGKIDDAELNSMGE